ncbi:IS21 family transposase [Salimicrobium jeotgali]|uniref:IS21 family transposase n=1 Tax=Salimicrobium jeotgali TaxID=1230341 RepID=UPI000C82A08D|nr:IS21 family transposase [Salimicrobium jeotgali]
MKKVEKVVYVHQLREEKFSIAAIARKTELSRTTVYEYLKMNTKEAVDWVETLKTRKRKLDPYHKEILSWLKEHPDLSASQISYWLDERCSFTGAGESTIRTYVRELRDEHHIPKELTHRSYEEIEELPKGYQMQVDFGETKVKTTEGKIIKVYVIAFVLSHSRYKYAEWQERPFTTRDVLRSHENAFNYYGGRTEEIVYDQDKLMTVTENNGDIIFTEEFQAYKQQHGFSVYLCRAADPESKGKVENVVKFIKMNFAKNRVFHNIESWNEKCWRWLEKKGNNQVHNTIKKRPVEVFALEKPHLRKVSAKLSFESSNRSIITRTVHKNNIIKYLSNRYTVPLGTYKPNEDNIVYVREEDGCLIIEKIPGDAHIATHLISRGKGELIRNTDHSRNKMKGIDAYKETVQAAFEDKSMAHIFLEEMSDRYPRYIRDQLQVIQKAGKHYSNVVEKALARCVKEELWSANDLYDISAYLHGQESSDVNHSTHEIPDLPSNPDHFKEKPKVRTLEGYLEILGGV